MDNEVVMPVLFIGHGTPMNAIEDNPFSRKWKEVGKILPRPEAILCISAHWETGLSMATAMDKPKTIHDFGGFPEELFRQQYPASGSPQLADILYNRIKISEIEKDYRWGLDHGTWSFLKHMYPDADIPVVQLSIDYTRDMQFHYNLGKELSFLRRKGMLIAGSGNMVHNLRFARPNKEGFNYEFAYEWAGTLNDVMKKKILAGDHTSMINYRTLTSEAHLGIPSEEHYIPLIYALGLQEPEDKVEIFNDMIVAGSISMSSLIIGNNIPHI
ncbi:4,5-DOPA dioxygenase extradiol [Parabacteroides sp. PF5-5]|uniref:4,5-DOPA-extradiol-dioxygenase n=1 Tax=unclassified Parabacteroides TaxID=2649774 RepID=UPI0024740659|nr:MULTISPECIES: 4,5-DOPA dioxygenase extradiol [unclassified Parabacteroides]MDH6303360.1 4,5-DOPA dioxygenase extradiol [Parabacteroides sp. PH5-39]MDH6314683.1 4,5-DOPA dioxygenase extradiol [Parabacteroides sp. PF5-13]MDH6318020.1 4,5-DOPA dioxygenase extradiol [Parabacteroides sp. PH5-13]MDH6322049.1 4,5-DOPA dioxygenase extradiol [Parabacteroides sp. PH5-8]MDH6326172.1 4,5-DOPA dioxygenase extradiol [Parabacteroides sp. PH5-41]